MLPFATRLPSSLFCSMPPIIFTCILKYVSWFQGVKMPSELEKNTETQQAELQPQQNNYFLGGSQSKKSLWHMKREMKAVLQWESSHLSSPSPVWTSDPKLSLTHLSCLPVKQSGFPSSVYMFLWVLNESTWEINQTSHVNLKIHSYSISDSCVQKIKIHTAV
jgi:hypothetical protein